MNEHRPKSKGQSWGKGSLIEKIIVRLINLTGKEFLPGIDTTKANIRTEFFLQKFNLIHIEITMIGQNTESASSLSGVIAATTRIK